MKLSSKNYKQSLKIMANLKQINSLFRKSCAIGLLLSCYALFVEIKKEVNADYVALCDINEHISCTKAFSSEYGKGFGIIGSVLGKDSLLNQPNSVAGIIFYMLLLIISFSDKRTVLKFQLLSCILSSFMNMMKHSFSLKIGTVIYQVTNDNDAKTMKMGLGVIENEKLVFSCWSENFRKSESIQN